MRLIQTAVLLALAGTAQAHDSWLEPKQFKAPLGIAVPVGFYIGHHGERDPATLSTRPAWLVGMQDVGPGGARNLLRQPAFNPERGISLPSAGTHLISLDTGDFENHAEPKAFESYLEEEGLTGALAAWRSAPIRGRKVREAYRRHAKSLIRVGSGARSVVGRATARLGQRLEIVPSSNPYRLRAGERMRATIWFRGSPLSGALVTLGSLDRPTDEMLSARSDARGRVSFSAPATGRWMMNVVWSERSTSPATDFTTSFSSLTFAAAGPS